MRFKNYFDGAEYKPRYTKNLSNMYLNQRKYKTDMSIDENGNYTRGNNTGQVLIGQSTHISLIILIRL